MRSRAVNLFRFSSDLLFNRLEVFGFIEKEEEKIIKVGSQVTASCYNALTNIHTKQQHLHSLQFNPKAIETFQHLQHQQQFNVLDAASPGLFRSLTPSSNSFIQI